ncbi:MAG: phosphoribosylformylglycinamidine synthase [Thiotrichales bacterium]
MQIVNGSSAFSDFQRKQLLKKLQEFSDKISGLSATYAYFIKLSQDLGDSEQAHLSELLSESGQSPADWPHGECFVVAPRPGTISPWSSKATDIAHNCGLSQIERIERGIVIGIEHPDAMTDDERAQLSPLLHDRMIESVFSSLEEVEVLFATTEPAPLKEIDISSDAKHALLEANNTLGLALSPDEIEYLAERYSELGRNPTDVELMMFAQANSEHCRHKIFNASWIIDGGVQSESLFGMIRNTYHHSPEGVLSAYKDNASVMRGWEAQRFAPNPESMAYESEDEPLHILMKVETHNHPTAISPFPGAATGSGGEIRDEGATGSGSRPKAGLVGYSVSNLRIPGFEQPWEVDHGKPDRIVSALEIMLEGPIGAAAFNNEFGRPGICGYFRSFEEEIETPDGPETRGYHKPIMLAGGVGSIREKHVEKHALPEGTPIIVLGGPAMLIGLGGGAASSVASGTSAEDLDFASVQRGNPEMQRRCQEVINHCTAQGVLSPILSIHDVGAGGLSNAVPEIINDAGRGGELDLRKVPNDEPGMSPMEVWSNEAQERYVLAIAAEKLEAFENLCARERCPFAVIGVATIEQRLRVTDPYFGNAPVDLPLEVMLGKPPKMERNVTHRDCTISPFSTSSIDLGEAVERVLRLPAVASKSFLITIGDRTVTGLIARDQMVGPWQVPVADVGVTLSDYAGYTGEAMALGERTPIALINPAASGRMAIGEAILNIAAARIENLSDIKLSANWMAAAGHPGEDAGLFDTVKAVGLELCPELGISIPVGKDSLSMKTVWEQGGESRSVIAPLSLIVSAFAPVVDARKTLTPQLERLEEATDLLLIDLAQGRQRLGGSALAQVYKAVGNEAPDLDDPELLKQAFAAIQSLNSQGLLLAYHDRSDGGLFTTLAEMAFAARTGLSVTLDSLGGDVMPALFNEELGFVIQIKRSDLPAVHRVLEHHGLADAAHRVGSPSEGSLFSVSVGGHCAYSNDIFALHQSWAETSYEMQKLRDNPDCANQELETISIENPGMNPHLGFDPAEDISAPAILKSGRPRVAILREQGVNGQVEMAAAFDRAGFTAVDVHMTDIMNGQRSLAEFQGLVACGGFSYGDVLGAGGGWAKSILYNSLAQNEFAAFFDREDVFGLGVCNGCQMFSQLKEIIPGAGHWPYFRRNKSAQFEARVSMVEVMPSPSIFLNEMQGSRLPIAVAHGEGQAVFTEVTDEAVMHSGLVTLRYVDNHGHPTEHYPENPNGSPFGITGLTTEDGRFTIMMPHPERVFRTVQNSWHPNEWPEDGPWLRMFRNARVWLG